MLEVKIDPDVSRRLNVGLSPTIPHKVDGIRMDPPPSPPMANGQNPAATLPADPEELPPQ